MLYADDTGPFAPPSSTMPRTMDSILQPRLPTADPSVLLGLASTRSTPSTSAAALVSGTLSWPILATRPRDRRCTGECSLVGRQKQPAMVHPAPPSSARRRHVRPVIERHRWKRSITNDLDRVRG